jgi:glycolate oxidase FAD binding subunit
MTLIPTGGTHPAREAAVQPGDVLELSEILARCGSESKTVELGGYFTKEAMGGAIRPADVVISTARLSRIVEYEPRDLTISAEAGVLFHELEELLQKNNQMLPLDPPDRLRSATIGGILAANCSGPRRRLYGTARDMVIGMTFVTLEGKQVRSGGMVVKNVAGLDMAKLLIGSFGTLAAIARVNFRVYPRPVQTRTFAASFPSLAAALKARDAILRSPLQPAAVDLLNPAAAAEVQAGLPSGYVVLVEGSGIEAVIARFERELKGIARETGAPELVVLAAEKASALWRAVRDFPSLNGPGMVLRISSTLSRLHEAFLAAGGAAAVARAGSGITYIHSVEAGTGILDRARRAGLYTVVESCSAANKEKLELWPDPGGELAVMARIKRDLDPKNLLNYGRLYNRL